MLTENEDAMLHLITIWPLIKKQKLKKNKKTKKNTHTNKNKQTKNKTKQKQTKKKTRKNTFTHKTYLPIHQHNKNVFMSLRHGSKLIQDI